MAWNGSDRKSRLPKDWEARRKRVLRMAKHVCAECGAKADQVDHSFTNLQALCGPCHDIKSSAEGQAARRANQARLRALTKRPEEKHPGELTRPIKPPGRRGW